MTPVNMAVRPDDRRQNRTPLTRTHKFCRRCQQMVERTLFHRSARGPANLQAYCKDCQAKMQSDDAAGYRARNRKTYNKCPAKRIYGGMKRRKDVAISREAFIVWYESQQRTCAYCDIPEELAIERTLHRLTVDRINTLRGYEEGNICLACLPCNCVKNGYLSFDEMREVGQRYMKPKWAGIQGNAYEPDQALIRQLVEALEAVTKTCENANIAGRSLYGSPVVAQAKTALAAAKQREEKQP